MNVELSLPCRVPIILSKMGITGITDTTQNRNCMSKNNQSLSCLPSVRLGGFQKRKRKFKNSCSVSVIIIRAKRKHEIFMVSRCKPYIILLDLPH